MVFAVPEKILRERPSILLALTSSEKNATWAGEYLIAKTFANELDLYQASVAFRRAAILAEVQNPGKVTDLEYGTLYCYYLAQKYSEVIEFFEKSSLRSVDASFSGYHDLLVILYDSYIQTDARPQAEKLLAFIRDKSPETAKKLFIWQAFVNADFTALQELSLQDPQIKKVLDTFWEKKKSVKTAEYLNSFLPGAGYFYLGQYQSGLTAIALNALFIVASFHYFSKGHIASGIIFAMFEMGWYDGGVAGAGHETKFYNERVYENLSIDLLWKNKLFPILMLEHGL